MCYGFVIFIISYTNNNAAYVAVEETYGDVSYNGHAKKGEEFRNDMTNFGILMEIKGIEPDPVLYAAPGEADDAIQTLLDERSNSMCRYTLIEWEFIFSEPIELDADAFLFEMGIGMD